MPASFTGDNSAAKNSNSIFRELLLRQKFLVLALRRADDTADSVSQKDCCSLISDLDESIRFFHSIMDGLAFPALARIANKEIADWEKELFVAFSAETPRWDCVLRLDHELGCIIEILAQAGQSLPEPNGEVEKWSQIFQVHKNLQDNVLRNWIVAEQTRGQPIKRAIDASETEWLNDWDDVLASLGAKANGVETDRENSIRHVVNRFLHPFGPKVPDRVA